MQGKELFTLKKAHHHLMISQYGWGGYAVYTGWLDGQPVVSDRTKGQAFKKLLEQVGTSTTV